MEFGVDSVIAGKFKLERYLGSGGMGFVYVARFCLYEDLLLALKILYPGLLKTEGARERFKKEVSALYTISHPNVVRAFEFFEDGELLGYAMELIEGEDLFTKIQREALPPRATVKILLQIASGIQAIHNAGIVHRDLKPENILISHKGEVKITDFGVAHLPDESALTSNGELVGTPKYLAPEYVRTGAGDFRSDIYSLGVIAFECLAGESPFRSTTKSSLIKERLSFKKKDIRRELSHCPIGLIDIVSKLMEIHPDRRYQSADEVVEVLQAYLDSNDDSIPIRDKYSNVPTRIPASYRNHFGFVLSITLFFIIGGLIAFLVPMKSLSSKDNAKSITPATEVKPMKPVKNSEKILSIKDDQSNNILKNSIKRVEF